MNYPTYMTELFFDIEISDLKIQSENGTFIETDNYKVISHEETFLGVKKTVDIGGSKKSLVFTHKQAHDLGLELYSSAFGEDQCPPGYYSSDNKNWVAFFIEPELKKFNNFYPIIGVENGYDYDDEIAFYLTIAICKSANSIDLLTISDYKLSDKKKIELLLDEEPQKKLSEIIKKEVSSEFKNKRDEFIYYYKLFNKIEVNREYLIPITLDIYDKNRNPKTIKVDGKLKNDLRNLIETGRKFFTENSTRSDLSLIIEFIMRSNLFRLNDPNWSIDKVKKIFVKKRAYKNSVERFKKLVNNDERLKEYAEGQMEAFKKAKEALES